MHKSPKNAIIAVFSVRLFNPFLAFLIQMKKTTDIFIKPHLNLPKIAEPSHGNLAQESLSQQKPSRILSQKISSSRSGKFSILNPQHGETARILSLILIQPPHPTPKHTLTPQTTILSPNSVEIITTQIGKNYSTLSPEPYHILNKINLIKPKLSTRNTHHPEPSPAFNPKPRNQNSQTRGNLKQKELINE